MQGWEARQIVNQGWLDGHSPVKALRLFLGLSLDQLASMAKIDPARLRLMEEHAHLSGSLATEREAIAEAIDIPAEVLF